MNRQHDINQFYHLLTCLEQKNYQKRLLATCTGKMNWPKRGVYFFFEPGEVRNNRDIRVVRVGTHAITQDSHTTLWERLRNHRGTIKGRHPNGGNHRGSIFRLHVGTAIISKENLEAPTWAVGNTAKADIRDQEYNVEKKVSYYIQKMPFLWLAVNDPPGPRSDRKYLEKNAIALLSNFNKNQHIDSSSSDWLGKYAWNKKVQLSGLWNDNHVDEEYNPDFLNLLKQYVEDM